MKSPKEQVWVGVEWDTMADPWRTPTCQNLGDGKALGEGTGREGQ